MIKALSLAAAAILATMVSACVIIVDKDDSDGKTGTRLYGPGSYDDIDEDIEVEIGNDD